MIALNIPMITWCTIIISMIALVIYRVCLSGHHHHSLRHHHLIEMGSERDEFFVPGDRLSTDDDIYDDYDD